MKDQDSHYTLNAFFKKILPRILENKQLNSKSSEDIRKDLRIIASHVLKVPVAKTLFGEDMRLSLEETQQMTDSIARYILNEPVSKIIQKKSFWKHDFFVNQNVLDPRPESECLVEAVLRRYNLQNVSSRSDFRILDIGTGSGCLIISIANELKWASCFAIDISEKAIDVARKNANQLHASNIEFVNIGWNQLLEQYGCDFFDVIVSNPPYIASFEIKNLDPNIKYDPIIALDGGENGLDTYCEIIPIAKCLLRANGSMFLEVGYNQSKDVCDILRKDAFSIEEVKKDLSKFDRIVIAKKQIVSK